LLSQGKSEAEISRLLGQSATTTNRDKARAFEQNLIDSFKKYVCIFPPEFTEKDRYRVINYAFKNYEPVLNFLRGLGKNSSGVELKSLQVLFPGDESLSDEDRIKLFGKMPGDTLIELIENCSICATVWGRTVKSTINGLEDYKVPNRPEMTVIPVSGEPVNFRDKGLSGTASQSAATLAKLFGCEAKCLSLQGLPARIPIKFDAQASTIRDFVGVSEAYKNIFLKNDPLIKKLDAVITGAGDVTSSANDPWFQETQSAEGYHLGAITVGNIAGVWIENDLSVRDQVEAINKRWLGIQREDIMKCAKRASPGVIMLAIGRQKAEIVMKSMGMVNHLFIDNTLAGAIFDKAPK
jgi:DNA-binding transcriptional regulator LsrR (DeoR family)